MGEFIMGSIFGFFIFLIFYTPIIKILENLLSNNKIELDDKVTKVQQEDKKDSTSEQLNEMLEEVKNSYKK